MASQTNTPHKARIGIYAGVFDPVHAGHVAFALQAILAADLDEVVFLPERLPRNKPGVEHFAHRVAMLKAALAPHPHLSVMEVVERHFSVARTLPGLQAVSPRAQLVFLMGSDAAIGLPAWRYADRLIAQSELVVGLRSSEAGPEVQKQLTADKKATPRMVLVDSYAPDVSSSKIRQALQRDVYSKGLLESVRQYARREWLYVSPGYQAA